MSGSPFQLLSAARKLGQHQQCLSYWVVESDPQIVRCLIALTFRESK